MSAAVPAEEARAPRGAPLGRAILPYALAVGSVALATVIALALRLYVDTPVLLFYVLAVAVTAWSGGFAPGMAATVLGVVAFDWWINPPLHDIDLLGTGDVVPLAIFTLVAGVVSWGAASLRDARARAELRAAEARGLAAELQEQAAELEQLLEESQSLQEELELANTQLTESMLAAERAEARTRELLESIGDAFIAHDAEWRFTYINERAAEIFRRSGHDPETMIGRSVWEAYPELVGTAFDTEMHRAVAEQRPVTFEAYYAARGEWSEMRVYPTAAGGVSVFWEDIGARKRADESRHYLAEGNRVLASSLDYEQTLAALAQLCVPQLADWCSIEVLDEHGVSLPIAVAHVDPVKAEFARELMRRYPRHPDAPRGVPHVLRTGASEIYPEITDELLAASAQDEEHLRLIRETGLRSAVVVPLLARDLVLGVLTLVSAESGRRYTADDLALVEELGRRAGIAVDNARLFRAEQKARAEAEAANRAKTEFLATMSHELRTPLNAIAGYTELLELGIHGPLSADQVETVHRIQRSGRHLLSLINDVLNFARIESGHVDLRIAPVSVDELLAAAESLILPQVRARELRYTYERIDDGVRVHADPDKLQQIVLNLLSNAVKFTSAGGRIALAASARDHVVEISVHDTGRGVPADKLDVIFDPFVQVERSLSRPAEGTGLGLAISRDLARAMGGEISVESTEGVGSTFTVTLPRADLAEAASEATQPPSAGAR